MTQLVFDWHSPYRSFVDESDGTVYRFTKPYNKGQISVPWLERHAEAYDRWIDDGFIGAEPMFEDFIPTMTKEN